MATAQRLVVVDRDKRLREGLANLLEGLFMVRALGSAEELLAEIDAGERVDAVVCELELPAMDGSALVAQLRLRGNAAASRTLLITASDLEPRTFEEPLLLKPFDFHGLLDALARLGVHPHRSPSNWPKRCGCGRTFDTIAWSDLPLLGNQVDDSRVLELRNCPCGSTIAVCVGSRP